MNFDLMLDAIPKLAAGIPLSLFLAGASIVIGFIIAIFTALSAISDKPILRYIGNGYIFIIRSTPLLVQLFLIYFGLGQLEIIRDSIFWGVLQSPMWCTIIALSLNTGAFSGEIFRGAFLSIPKGQLEAAKAGGMSWFLSLRRVVFPVGLRLALPSYGNEIVMMIKATALASTVTLLEITGIAHKLIATTFQPIEIFVVAGAFYLIINFALTRLIKWVEFRTSAHLR